MSTGLLRAYVAAPILRAFAILGICVATAVTIARFYVRHKRHGRLFEDDYMHILAVLLNYTLCGLYLADIKPMYGFLAFTSGEKPITLANLPIVQENFRHMIQYSFAVTTLFWCVLWAVKLTLLLLWRKLLRDTGFWRMAYWWFALACTIIAFVGCVISEFTSCSSLPNFEILGGCASPEDKMAQLVSLYLSFALDVITEILVMAAPLMLLRKLRRSRSDKIRLICPFSVGLATIVVSFVRVFVIYWKTHNTTPSPPWLGLWAIIECMTAIVAGSIPAISQMFRSNNGSYGSGYDSAGFRHNSRSYGAGSQQRASLVPNARTSLGSNPGGTFLDSTGRSKSIIGDLEPPVNKKKLALDTVSIDSSEKAEPTDLEQQEKVHTPVDIQTQVFIEQKQDNGEKHDDHSRWMVKGADNIPKAPSI